MFVPGQAGENDPNEKVGLLSGAKRSKSKRNPKGGSLLKAYFPNLISNKDPTKAKGSDLHPSKKKLFGSSKSQRGGDSDSGGITLLPGGPALPGQLQNLTKKRSAMDHPAYDS